MLLRNWEPKNLQNNVNKFLEAGWDLYEDTFTYMEFRNHAVTGEEYKAVMFCQSMIKLSESSKKPDISNKTLTKLEVFTNEEMHGCDGYEPDQYSTVCQLCGETKLSDSHMKARLLQKIESLKTDIEKSS